MLGIKNSIIILSNESSKHVSDTEDLFSLWPQLLLFSLSLRLKTAGKAG